MLITVWLGNSFVKLNDFLRAPKFFTYSFFDLVLYENLFLELGYSVDIVKVDALAQQKNPKCHFFRAIVNSFHEVT